MDAERLTARYSLTTLQSLTEGPIVMTTTPETGQAQAVHAVERTYGGMPKWALLGAGIDSAGKLRLYWPYTTDIGGKRFLTRFMVLRCPLAAVSITRIYMADDQREYPHDHSHSFASLKFGWYAEDVYYDKGDLTSKRHRRHRRFSVHLLRYTQAHSITEVSPHLVTVLVSGPTRQKSSYWTPDGLQSTGMAVDQDEQS